MRILLRDGASRRSVRELSELLMELRFAAIRVEDGGRYGGHDVLIIDSETDAKRAMAVLAKLRVDAVRDSN